MAATFEQRRESYDAMVLQQSAGQPVAAAIDGNQKLTRQTCAEQMADLQHIPRAFCSLHCRPDARDDGVRVFKRAALPTSRRSSCAQPQPMLLTCAGLCLTGCVTKCSNKPIASPRTQRILISQKQQILFLARPSSCGSG